MVRGRRTLFVARGFTGDGDGNIRPCVGHVVSPKRSLDFCVSQASEIPLAGEELALVLSVEIGGTCSFR